jgi:hypothetical protein
MSQALREITKQEINMGLVKILFGKPASSSDKKLKVRKTGLKNIPAGVKLYSINTSTGSLMRHQIDKVLQAYIYPGYLPLIAINDLSAVKKATKILESIQDKKQSLC